MSVLPCRTRSAPSPTVWLRASVHNSAAKAVSLVTSQGVFTPPPNLLAQWEPVKNISYPSQLDWGYSLEQKMGCVFQCLFSLSFSVGRTCLCVCRYACICVCIHMQAKGPSCLLFLWCYPLGGRWWVSALSRLGCLGNKPQGSSCLHLPQPTMTNAHHHTQLFVLWVLGIELRSFMFTGQALSWMSNFFSPVHFCVCRILISKGWNFPECTYFQCLQVFDFSLV